MRKSHRKLNLETGWHIFDILTSEDIDDVISRFRRKMARVLVTYNNNSNNKKENYTAA